MVGGEGAAPGWSKVDAEPGSQSAGAFPHQKALGDNLFLFTPDNSVNKFVASQQAEGSEGAPPPLVRNHIRFIICSICEAAEEANRTVNMSF